MTTCVIEIKDEVNCKLEGLELSERKAFVKMFEYEKPGARYLPSVRLGRWNGKVSYFSLGGSSYFNLLDKILPTIVDEGYEILFRGELKSSVSLLPLFVPIVFTGLFSIIFPIISSALYVIGTRPEEVNRREASFGICMLATCAGMSCCTFWPFTRYSTLPDTGELSSPATKATLLHSISQQKCHPQVASST